MTNNYVLAWDPVSGNFTKCPTFQNPHSPRPKIAWHILGNKNITITITRSSLNFGWQIRKNYQNSEKFCEKFRKILYKICKSTPKNLEKNSKQIWILEASSLFPTMTMSSLTFVTVFEGIATLSEVSLNFYYHKLDPVQLCETQRISLNNPLFKHRHRRNVTSHHFLSLLFNYSNFLGFYH